MKSLTLAPLLALASLSFAQLQGLPSCATTCADIFLNGGIGNCGRDPACICADKSFIGSISCCLIAQCDASDQQKAIDFAQQICQANKISVPNIVSCAPTASTFGSAAPSSSAAAGSGSSPSSSSSTGSSTPANNSATTTRSTPSSTASTSSSGSAAGASSSSSAASTTASAASKTTNSGPRPTAAPVLGALGGLVAVAALL